MKSALFAAALSVAAVGGADGAHAAIITYDLSGTVDVIFGSSGIVVGDALHLVQTINIGNADVTTDPVGGVAVGNNTLVPVIGSATLTIGSNYSLPLSPTDDTSLSYYPGYNDINTAIVESDASSVGLEIIVSSFVDPLAPQTLTNVSGFGNFYDGRTAIIGGFEFNAVTITTTAVSAVPLPAGLPMFGAALLGLGAVGFGLSRKRKTALSA